MLFAVLFLSLIYVVQFVSAASIAEDMNAFVQGTVSFLSPFSVTLLGDTPSGELLFAKVLFFMDVSSIWQISRPRFFALPRQN